MQGHVLTLMYSHDEGLPLTGREYNYGVKIDLRLERTEHDFRVALRIPWCVSVPPGK